jgi:hypothetical protein
MTILFSILSLSAVGLPLQPGLATGARLPSQPALEAEAVRSPQPALEAEAVRFAEAWSASDTESLSRLLAEDGIRLHLPEEEHVLIRPRQARAALDAFLGRHGRGEARVTRASLAGGSLDRGFAEIRWATRSPGLPEPVIFTLFVGYSLEDDRWTVTEIRVLF